MLYGIADVAVLAVGGFLLLPLYTRTLSQEEFGAYVVVRTNIEIFSYLLFFGLHSAVARIYFDYRKTGEQIEYLNSILSTFLVILLGFIVLMSVWGTPLWSLLSPTTPSEPYLRFTLAIAAASFFSGLATLWLRLESRPVTLVGLQVAASAILAGLAVLNLGVLRLGLSGLLWALLVSAASSALALPWLFGRRFRLAIGWSHLRSSLPYAVPIVIGYVAYFVLNRINTLILQRHVELDQIAVYGLAQQLAAVLTIAATAFGKAAQPPVFAAEPALAAELMRRYGSMLILLMTSVATLMMLFAGDLIRLVAPPSYGSGFQPMLVVLFGSFAYSFTMVFNTALLYHRRPRTSVAVSICGAVLSAALGLLLIPRFHLLGAAVATAGAFAAMTFLSHWIARRLTGHDYMTPMLISLAGIGGVALFSAWLQAQGLQPAAATGIKLVVACPILFALYQIHARKAVNPPCAP